MNCIKGLLSAVALTFCGLLLHAEEQPALKYVDAHAFRVINRAYKDTTPLYTRIPDAMRSMTRDDIWGNGQHSCGVGIRFRTNSTVIGARYNLKYNGAMTWMAHTGIKGTDLYILDEGEWHYLATARPMKDSVQQRIYTNQLDGKMCEYMIYLPLYDGINWFEIGVDSAAVIDYPAVDNPRLTGKVVFFGTSVMQGGCASRTGMTQTSILQRRLGIECVNLGISGNGKLYPENARVLAAADDVACYVIDPLMNCTKEMVDTLAIPFMRVLRETHPNVPIIMVEGQVQPQQKYDKHLREYNPVRSQIWKSKYDQLKKEGWKNLYFMTEGDFDGPNKEGTVDGAHLTDLGFWDYAMKIEPYIRKALKMKKK